MSPEQKEDMKNVDKRSDVYSFAIVLCEMLSGKPDRQGVIDGTLKFPLVLTRVIEKACAYEKEDRYSDAEQFLQELKQVSSHSSTSVDTSSKAICTNFLCPSANWSPRGFYRGVRVVEDCIDPFCKECGAKLVYQCETCRKPIENAKYCGGCGTQQFEVPECSKCGSYLKKIDMNNDTEKHGCEKCRSRPAQEKPIDDGFDDIPF